MMRRPLLKALAMLSWPATAAAGRRLSAAAFWDLYFSDAFVRLERSAAGLRGVVTANVRTNSLRDMLRAQTEEDVWVARQDLQQHDDAGDARFVLFQSLGMSTDAAAKAIAGGHYPYRSAPPYAPPRMATLVGDLRQAALASTGAGSALTVPVLARWLQSAVKDTQAIGDLRITAGAWLLGERRDAAGAAALLTLLDEVGRSQVSSSASDAAYAALWKIADPAVLDPLCAQMERAAETARWKYAKLFERLLSTHTLLGSAHLGDAYTRPGTWRDLIERGRLTEPAHWKGLQIRALRWELRALQARRLADGDTELAELVALDEVAAVRRARQGG